VPSVAAYRIPALEGLIFRAVRRNHPVIKVRSIILANLVLGEWAIPEFVQSQCTAENLAAALIDILGDTPSRQRQIEAFKRLETITDAGGVSPSRRAAQAVLDLVERRSAMR
jgi:lipid-A-disaccharide synthase